MMCSLTCGLAVTFLAALAAPVAWAQAEQTEKPQAEIPQAKTPQTETSSSPPQDAKGRVSIVEENVWIIFSEEPSQHFHQARADFWKEDMIGAATEILKGAAFLKLAADTAGGEAKDALTVAVRQLDLLAYNVQMGGTVYITDFDKQFASAEAAMANYFFLKAKEAWAKKDHKSAGLYLRASTVSLRNAWGWTGEKPASDTTTVIKETETLTSQLVGGAGWTEDQVTTEIDQIGTEIDKVKQKTAAKK